jgi:hypothetical protein
MPGSRTARCRDFPGPCSGNPPFERNGEGYGRRQGRGHCRRVQKARYRKLPAAPPLQSRYANPRAPFTGSDVFKRDGRFGLTNGLVHRLATDFRSRLSEDDDRLNGVFAPWVVAKSLCKFFAMLNRVRVCRKL